MRHLSHYILKGSLLIALCLCLSIISRAQTHIYSNLTVKKISTTSTAPLDSLTVEPASLILQDVDPDCYTFSTAGNRIIFSRTCRLPDSVIVSYRHFPFNLGQRKRAGRYSFDTTFVFKIYEQEPQEWYQRSPLTYSGSYSRNMQLGNNQDVSMNSNFNLQVSGYLMDSIYIEGAITDNQLPFQPDGNTQQVQEFDKIYIILEKNRHRMTFGDFNLDRNTGHFLKFNKRGQGVFYQGKEKKWGQTEHDYGVSVSVSKGQYARNQFEGIEGNQGPYKLVGNNGETFFIILAGTEKVYMDGVLLTRGEDKDYIINYNTSEILFMPRRLITKDKRIQVEFEYQDRNYLNSLIYAYDNIRLSDRFRLNLSFYSNQDARNQPYLQDITDDQKRFLYGIGDSIQNALYQNVREEAFAPNKILYIQKDTTIAATGETFFGIYEYSTDSTATLYSLGFSHVGEFKGNYIISGENSNGRSYQWVAPADGVPQGNYEPVTLLITPKMHQVYNAGFEYQPDSLKKLSFESSASIYDPNLFSPLNNDEHLGLGGKIDYTEKRLLGAADSLNRHRHHLDNAISYEYLQHNYRAISPFRSLEFSRDWNIIETEPVTAHQHFGRIRSQYTRRDRGHVLYEFLLFNQENYSNAYKNIAELQYTPRHTMLRLHADILNSSSLSYRSRFLRPHLLAEREFGKDRQVKAGSKWELEHNEVRYSHSDTLTPYSFSFDTWTSYIQSQSLPGMTWNLKYIQRRERLTDSSGGFKLNNVGHNIEMHFALTDLENHQLELSAGYRYLDLYDTNKISASNAGGSLLGRVNYSGNIYNGFFTPVLQYEFGNGQEQKREFTYIEVPAGQGMYYWIDYNEDGVQQANEFEIGIYPDQKRFIRIFTPTNEYIGMSYYNLQASATINFSKIFPRESTGMALFLSKFHNQFSLQQNTKSAHHDEAGFLSSYIPFAPLSDSFLINKNTSLMNTLFFNRTNAQWGIDYSVFLTESKTLLTYGLESQKWLRQIVSARWMLSRSFTSQMKYTWGSRNYFSGITDSRTYDFRQHSIAPSLSYMYGQSWRVTGTYLRDVKRNAAEFGGEEALIQNLTADLRFSLKKLGSLQSSFTYSKINFSGDDNTAVSLIMLDALKKGHNMLWNLQWNTMLTKGIEMSIIYEGRKPAGQSLIHTGNMTIRAIL